VSTTTRWGVLLVCVALFAATGTALGRKNTHPDRLRFSLFPAEIGRWSGSDVRIANSALEVLELTDYLSRDYRRSHQKVNLYVGFHGSQQRGSLIHSPAHCLPANGWYVEHESLVPMPGRDDGTLVNRMEVAYGKHRDIVYYWYQGRGRIIAGEFTSAVYRAFDVALYNRSDEALVRFITENRGRNEERMREFIAEVMPRLEIYLPE
jgi:EpsI family protein